MVETIGSDEIGYWGIQRKEESKTTHRLISGATA